MKGNSGIPIPRVPICSPKFLSLGAVYGSIHPDGKIIHHDEKVIHLDDPFSEVDEKIILMDGRFIHKDKLSIHMDDPFSDHISDEWEFIA